MLSCVVVVGFVAWRVRELGHSRVPDGENNSTLLKQTNGELGIPAQGFTNPIVNPAQRNPSTQDTSIRVAPITNQDTKTPSTTNITNVTTGNQQTSNTSVRTVLPPQEPVPTNDLLHGQSNAPIQVPGIHSTGPSEIQVAGHGNQKIESPKSVSVAPPQKSGPSDESRKDEPPDDKELGEFIDRYLDRSATKLGGAKQWAILIPGLMDELNSPLTMAAREVLEQRRLAVVSIFRPAIVKDNRFDELFDGNKSLIKKLTIEQFCTSIIVGKVTVAFSRDTFVADLIAANVTCHIRFVSASSAGIENEFRIESRGGGFSEATARSQGLERLTAALRERLNAAIP